MFVKFTDHLFAFWSDSEIDTKFWKKIKRKIHKQLDISCPLLGDWRLVPSGQFCGYFVDCFDVSTVFLQWRDDVTTFFAAHTDLPVLFLTNLAYLVRGSIRVGEINSEHYVFDHFANLWDDPLLVLTWYLMGYVTAKHLWNKIPQMYGSCFQVPITSTERTTICSDRRMTSQTLKLSWSLVSRGCRST